VILIVLGISTIVGISVRTAFERVVQGAIRLRQNALETLEHRNQELQSTSVTIAHELKNPMSSIQGLAQLMSRRAEAGSKDRERLDVMLREIGRMTTVLDEFRSFSRPLSGLTHRSVSLSELLTGLIALHEGSAAKRGITLVAEAKEDVTAECDGQKLKQALVNLIQNAIESSPTGAQVRVTAQRKGENEVILQVLDAGPGIDPQQRDLLFRPGFTTKEKGTGIGLVVARSVVQQHGGTLVLENRTGGGCAATITLPAKAPTQIEVLT
jgi:signal transduction histidine kinase